MACWRWGGGGQPRARLKERGRRVWLGLRELVAGVVVGGVGLVGQAGEDGRGEGAWQLRRVEAR